MKKKRFDWNRFWSSFFYTLAGLMSGVFMLIALSGRSEHAQVTFKNVMAELSVSKGTVALAVLVTILFRAGKIFSNRKAKSIVEDILDDELPKRPFVLTLRPFFADKHALRQEEQAWLSFNIFRAFDPRRGLEARLEKVLEQKADLVKIGGDRKDTSGSTLKTNPRGFFRKFSRNLDERFDYDNWRNLVLSMAEKASIILLVPLVKANSGTDWEVSQIVKNQWTEKLVLIMPPKGKVQVGDGDPTTMEEAWAECRHTLRNRYGIQVPRYHGSGALLMREEVKGEFKVLTYASGVHWRKKHALKQFLLYGRNRSSTWRELLRIGIRFTFMLYLLPLIVFLFSYVLAREMLEIKQHSGLLALATMVLSLLAFYPSTLKFASRFDEVRSIGRRAFKIVFFSATAVLIATTVTLFNFVKSDVDAWIDWIDQSNDLFLAIAFFGGFLYSAGLTIAFYLVLSKRRGNPGVLPHL